MPKTTHSLISNLSILYLVIISFIQCVYKNQLYLQMFVLDLHLYLGLGFVKCKLESILYREPLPCLACNENVNVYNKNKKHCFAMI